MFSMETNTMIETVLYGIPKGATERYEEVLLLTSATPEKIKKVKALAAKDGFHSFRVAKINLNHSPDFTKAVQSENARSQFAFRCVAS
jgi:hypothetical protein